MYDHILVYCRAERGADASVTHAIELTASLNARLTLLYLTQLGGTEQYRASHVKEKVEGVDEDADVDDEIQALAKEAGIEYDVLVEHDMSGSTVSSIAEREGADAIVIGSVGKPTLKRLLEGSIANEVVQSASLPVLTIQLNEEDVRGINVYECRNCRGGFESTAAERDQVQCPYCGSENLADRTIN